MTADNARDRRGRLSLPQSCRRSSPLPFRIDAGFEWASDRIGNEAKKVFCLLDDPQALVQLIRVDVAENASSIAVEVRAGAVQRILHMRGNNRHGDNLCMGVLERGSPIGNLNATQRTPW